MAHVIKVRKAGQVAFGLDWLTLPGAAKPHIEVRRLARERKASHVTLYPKEDGDTLVGLSTGKPFKGKAIAAATLFARMVGSTNAMFIHAFEDGVHVLIGVMDGVPMPGFDRVGGKLEIEQLADKFAKLRPGVAPELYGNVALEGSPVPVSVFELAARTRKHFKKAMLRSTKFPIKTVLAVVALAAITVAGNATYEKWQQKLIREQEAQRQIADPNAWYRQAVPPLLASAGYAANKTAQVYLDALDKLPQLHAGWRLAEATCSPGSCQLTWKIEQGGSFGSFKRAALPYLSNITYQQDQATVFSTLVFPMPADAAGQQEAKLPKQADFEFEQDDTNQKLDGLYPKVIRQPASNILTPPPNISESALTSIINVGGWEIKGFLHSADILRTLPDNMTLDSYVVTFAPGAFSLFVQGKYYVKK